MMGIKFKQEHWTAMIISSFAEKAETSIQDAIKYLLENDGLSYLEEHYEVLHQLANIEVVDDLFEITGHAQNSESGGKK
jgi:F0F1-type ATP synthase delta subunit